MPVFLLPGQTIHFAIMATEDGADRHVPPRGTGARLSGVRTLGRTAARQRVSVPDYPNSPWVVDATGIRDDETPEDPDSPGERIRLQRMDVYLEAAKSDDHARRLAGLRCIRFLFTASGRVPIWLIIESDLHSSLISHIQPGADEPLLFETVWIAAQLTKTRSRANLQALLSNDIIGELARVLDLFVSPRVTEQSLRCLSRLARVNLEIRDEILANETVIPVLQRISVSAGPPSMFGSLASAICSLLQGSPAPNVDAVIEPLMPVVATLFKSEDVHAINSLLFALAYLAESNPRSLEPMKELALTSQITAALDGSLAERLLQSEFSSGEYSPSERAETEMLLLVPALRTVVGMASAGEDFIQELIDANAILPLRDLIDHDRRDVRVLATRALANLAQGTQDHIQALLDADFADLTRSRLEREGHTTVKKNIAIFYARICCEGTPEQISTIVSRGGLRSMWHVAGLVGIEATTDIVVTATEAALMTLEGALARQALIDIQETDVFEILDRQGISDRYFERITEAMFFCESRAA
ncbi:Importin subunit alpha [Hondaea fermentalgiana]|uniref:Importin subunit alpha n=1 Tax=Hondaea fermentalgiana TaxID=2315210 RepID=A0A2R5GYM3_9STRA|nr:Importin subunit alpha [Hondaea fermentalgiana]|eukprot:GBG33833.1 Importin subunit alpha [Hondaea fermentalgiana]